MTITQTYYEHISGNLEWQTLDNPNFPNKAYGSILGNNYGWLANSLANLYYPSDYWYCIMIVKDIYLCGEQIGYSKYDTTGTSTWGIRPLITIKNVKLASDTGDSIPSRPWKLTK